MCLPVLVFTSLTCISVFFFHSTPELTWAAATIYLCMSALFMVLRQAKEGPKFWFNLGGMCFLAVVLGTTAGLWNFNRYMYKYWAYHGSQEYKNVAAGDLAASHLDAGRIWFTQETHVDLQKSFASASDGSLFCVAPVVGSLQSTAVQFWAAGVSCCGRDGKTFECDDATHSQAHGGLVLLEDPFFADGFYEQFRKAASMAALQQGLTSDKDALFLRFVENPEEAHKRFWNKGVLFTFLTCFAYAVFSLVVGLNLHFARRSVPKMKLESRKFEDLSSIKSL